MARLRTNFIQGTVTDNPLLVGATTLNSAGLANLPAVSSPDIIVLVLDPDKVSGAQEIVYITAHTASATSATISRGKEGSSAREHPQATGWIHAPVAADLETGIPGAKYVAKTGSDTNDGLSWTRAKLTIQAAIDSLPATGGVVYIGPGTYNEAISTEVPNLELIGSGHSGLWSAVGVGATVISVSAGAVGFTFNPSAASTVFRGPALRNLAFNGVSTATGGVLIKRTNNYVLQNVAITDFTGGYGIHHDGTGNVNQYGQLLNCNIATCQIGSKETLTNGLRYIGCYFDGDGNSGSVPSGRTGIQQISGDTSLITGCVLQFWETCVDWQSGEGHQISTSRLEGFTTGIKIAADRSGVYGGSFNNFIVGAGGTAISVLAAADKTILMPADIASVTTDISDSGTNTMRFWGGRFGGVSGYLEPSSGFLTSYDSFKVNRHLWFNISDDSTGSFLFGSSGSLFIRYGTGSPEGVVTASKGSLFMRTDGGAGTTFYVKESGTGNTGWVGK